MAAPRDPLADEVGRLRTSLNNLVSVMALPALWAGGEAPRIIGTVLDALLGMLPLAVVFVRLNDPDGGRPVEMTRVAGPLNDSTRTGDIGRTLDASLGNDPLTWPRSAQVVIEGIPLSLTSIPIGLYGEFGIVVAGAESMRFPEQEERLVLDVAANQTAMSLQQARLLAEQRRVASELDARVARRTNELASANAELTKEIAERRRAEAALRDSERESRLIVDSIPGLVALLTATGDVDVVNRQLLEYFGQPLEELRQWGTNGTVHPEDLPHVAEVFSRSVATGTPYEIVQRLRRADGVYRWIQNSGVPVHDPAGRVVRWCVLLTDVDGRKRAEDAIRTSERNLQLIIDSIPAAAWSTRADGSAEFFSQHYLDYVGLQPDQTRGWGWTAAVHPDDVTGLVETWHRIMASQALGEAEARLRRHDGTYRWFLFRVNPLRDESGAIVRWYGTHTDIDDRRRAEEALRRSEAFLIEGQHLAGMGNFSWRVTTNDIEWSEPLYRIFEFEPGTPVTLDRIAAQVHREDLPLMQDMVARAGRGESAFEYAPRLVMPDGSVKHLHLVAHRAWDEQSGIEYIGAVQDVTQRRAAEEALSQARAELTRVARAMSLGTLTASIAHEVNQPLSGIITNASTCLRMLASEPPDVDGARETARRTIRDGNRAADVITQLRALYSKKDFAVEPMDLNEVTREVIALSMGELQRNHVVLRLELAEDLPTVDGDRVQIQQVVLNLLRNASDAMVGVDDRARLVVINTGQDDGDRVRLTVRDAGVGLDRESMDKLFDAFFTTKLEGMGIGLSVSRSIIERHNGRLWAEPNDGPGATFSFAIPRGLAAAVAKAGP